MSNAELPTHQTDTTSPRAKLTEAIDHSVSACTHGNQFNADSHTIHLKTIANQHPIKEIIRNLALEYYATLQRLPKPGEQHDPSVIQSLSKLADDGQKINKYFNNQVAEVYLELNKVKIGKESTAAYFMSQSFSFQIPTTAKSTATEPAKTPNPDITELKSNQGLDPSHPQPNISNEGRV